MNARRVLAAGIAVALLGCGHIAPYNDPLEHPLGGDAPRRLFAVDWWHALVPPVAWEVAPLEAASPTVQVNEADHRIIRVISLTRDGLVRSFTGEGKPEWSFKTRGPFSTAATIDGDTLYVPGGDGTLYALSLTTGVQKWAYASGEELATPPLRVGEKVLVASHGDTLFAVDASTGQWKWQYRGDVPSGFTIRGVSAPKVTANVVYLGFSDGRVVALGLNDGSVQWEKALSSPGGQFVDVDATPILDGTGRLFTACYKEGVFALDAKSGDIKWQSPQVGIVSLIRAGKVLIASGTEQVSALDSNNGKVLWTHDLHTSAGRTPTVTQGLVVVPTKTSLLFLDATTGQGKLSWNPGYGVSAAPVAAGGKLFVLSNGGSLYSLRVGRGI